MCNTVVSDSDHFKHINITTDNETMFGWKVFYEHNDGILSPALKQCYNIRFNEVNQWDTKCKGDGFCFFVGKKHAELTACKLSQWRENIVVKKILCKEVVACFDTLEIDGETHMRMGVCKQFTILEEGS